VNGRPFRRLRPLRGQSGYALTELLTVLIILSIVLGGLTALFISATKAEVDMRERFDAQQEARLAVDALRREVHCANALTQPSSPSATVTMTLPAGCPSGSPSVAIQVTWCTISAGSNRYQLYRKTGTTCDSSGKQYADYLAPDPTSSDPTTVCGSPPSLCVFEYADPAASTRAKLMVEFPVDLSPTDAIRAYKLTDGLVLRNTSPTG
jgi:prepilin-type N-terminal cleavage/methylation domain-containing protein